MAALAVLGLLGSMLLASGTALAAHDDAFQLDGDTTATDQTPGSPGDPSQDWDSLFNANGTNKAAINPANDPGFTHGDFIRDFRSKEARSDSCTVAGALSSQGGIFCTNDTTTYATGSKDTLPISGWQCSNANNVNSKIDIMNAYAASYVDADGDRIIYFGLDKNKDNGNNNVGFWFLQGNANCDASGGTATWSGSHTDGDVLVVSEFTNGGGVSGITAYQWAGGANGCIDSDGDASRCDGLSFGQGGDCKATAGGDNICATTNSGGIAWNTNVTTQWLTSDATLGVGNTVVPPDFFEGGINITKIFEAAGDTAPSCFNTFIADTRSSQSLTATLFDYARGQLGQCSASITTQASTNSTTVVPGTIVTDTATITGTSGSIPPFPSSDESTGGSNVKFYICELLAGTGDCTSTDVQVGPAGGQELTPTATQGVSTATSAGYDTTGKAPGRYCFFAVWPGDSNYTDGASGGAAATECFTIAKLPTTTVTTPGTLSGTTFTPVTTVTLGTSVVDRAVVTGSAAGGDPTGNVNFFLCGPIASPALCTAGGTEGSTNPVGLVSDANAATFTSIAYSSAFTPTAVGRYCFRAVYGGSGVYDGSSDSAANECFTVTDTTGATSAQTWVPNDSATVTSTNGALLSGTLKIELFETDNCTGSVVTGQTYTKSVSGVSTSTLNTNNSTYVVSVSKSVSWLTTFTSTDPNVSGTTHCEKTSLTITN